MKKKIFQPKILLFIVLSILIFAGVVFAINTISTGYRLNKATIMQVRSPSACYQATNTGSTNDYFVPTKTSAELTSFVSNHPGDVTLVSCSSLPPRIAGWQGVVNQHTDSNGVWIPDPDCVSGYELMDTAPERITYCRKFNSETINSAAYAIETITNWADKYCVNLHTGTKQSYKCILCTDYFYESACTSAGCNWHPYGYVCFRLPCSFYYSSTTCTNAGCYWDGYSCYNVPDCSWYYDEYECDSDYNCNWDNYQYCCYDIDDSCSYYYSQYDCEMYGCQWDSYNYVCHEFCVVMIL